MTAHPVSRPVSFTTLGAHAPPGLLHDVHKSSDRLGFVELLGVEVFAHGRGQCRLCLPRASVRGLRRKGRGVGPFNGLRNGSGGGGRGGGIIAVTVIACHGMFEEPRRSVFVFFFRLAGLAGLAGLAEAVGVRVCWMRLCPSLVFQVSRESFAGEDGRRRPESDRGGVVGHFGVGVRVGRRDGEAVRDAVGVEDRGRQRRPLNLYG